MLSAIILTSAVILSPDPQAVKPVARPLCLMNVNANTIVYAGDVQAVRLSADKTTVQILTVGNKVASVAVPTGASAETYRTAVAKDISETWARCKKFQ